MMRADCAKTRCDLGAFLDGELQGAARVRLQAHVACCAECRREADALLELGEQVREELTSVETPPMAGLAAGVVSRVRAERAQSWRALWARASDDWRWAIVGFGSLASTAATTLFVSSVLWFGPPPEREDSLAAMLSVVTPKPAVFMIRPAGQSWDQFAWRVASGQEMGRAAAPGARPAAVSGFFVSDQDAVLRLADVLAPNGHMVELSKMRALDRAYAEQLLETISSARLAPARVILTTSTTVSAKGL